MPTKWHLEKTRGTGCFSKYFVKEGMGPSIHKASPLAISKLRGEESLSVNFTSHSMDITQAPVPSQATSQMPHVQVLGGQDLGAPSDTALPARPGS